MQSIGWTAAFYGVGLALLFNSESADVTLFSIGLIWFGAAIGGWFTRSRDFVLVYPLPLFLGVVLSFLWLRDATADHERTGVGSLAPGVAVFAIVVCVVLALVLMATAYVAVSWSKSRVERARCRMHDNDRDYIDASNSHK